MKKWIVLLSLLLLLPSCGRNSHNLNVEDAAALVLEEYGDTDSFVQADEDFITTNFGTHSYVEEAAVYFSKKNDGTEFGFFRLKDSVHKSEMEVIVREYIASERQSVESLAALYPAEELTQRLERFDHATVGSTGDLIYYFITEKAMTERALKQIHQ